jgi:hypothetical protein
MPANFSGKTVAYKKNLTPFIGNPGTIPLCSTIPAGDGQGACAREGCGAVRVFLRYYKQVSKK